MISLNINLYNILQFKINFIILIFLILCLINQSLSFDFQVGNYLNKFFKKILPNNTNFNRKKDDLKPNQKYFSQLYGTHPYVYHTKENNVTEIDLQGLTFFKPNENFFPTLPFCNFTYEEYKAHTSTIKTTPSKESLLRLGKIFEKLMGRKGAMRNVMESYERFMKDDSELKRDHRLDNSEDLELINKYNFDQHLEEVLNKTGAKFKKNVENYYNITGTFTTTTERPHAFVEDLQEAYKDHIVNQEDLEEETILEETTTLSAKSIERERKDNEQLELLREIGREYINQTELDEVMNEISTPEGFTI